MNRQDLDKTEFDPGHTNHQGFWKKMGRYFVLIFRPFYDFYYNFGLGKAAILAYVLCANLLLITYIMFAFNFSSAINPFRTVNSSQRFLEVHFLWPIGDQVQIDEVGEEAYKRGFSLREGIIVTREKYEEALAKYKEKYDHEPELQTTSYSVTHNLGKKAHRAIKEFNSRSDTTAHLSFSLFFLFAIAYIALLLSTRNALAEVDSPIVQGNVPLKHRSSEILRLMWYLPSWNSIKVHLNLFLMLPILTVVLIGLLSWGQMQIDRLIDPYSTANTIIILFISFTLITILFWMFYKFSLNSISPINLLIGAIVASLMWLGGRWFFSNYTAISFERSLRNFAFIPIVITWLYYFAAVFLIGAHVAHTIEYSYLNSVSRSWIRKEVLEHSKFHRTANWIKMDFLLRLAHYHYHGGPKIYLRIGPKRRGTMDDVADKIAVKCRTHPAFVREVLSEMIVRYLKPSEEDRVVNGRRRKVYYFKVDFKYKRQICYLVRDPEKIDIIPIVFDLKEEKWVLDELDQYEELGLFARQFLWPKSPRVSLAEIYGEAVKTDIYFLEEVSRFKGDLEWEEEEDEWEEWDEEAEYYAGAGEKRKGGERQRRPARRTSRPLGTRPSGQVKGDEEGQKVKEKEAVAPSTGPREKEEELEKKESAPSSQETEEQSRATFQEEPPVLPSEEGHSDDSVLIIEEKKHLGQLEAKEEGPLAEEESGLEEGPKKREKESPEGEESSPVQKKEDHQSEPSDLKESSEEKEGKDRSETSDLEEETSREEREEVEEDVEKAESRDWEEEASPEKGEEKVSLGDGEGGQEISEEGESPLQGEGKSDESREKSTSDSSPPSQGEESSFQSSSSSDREASQEEEPKGESQEGEVGSGSSDEEAAREKNSGSGDFEEEKSSPSEEGEAAGEEESKKSRDFSGGEKGGGPSEKEENESKSSAEEGK